MTQTISFEKNENFSAKTFSSPLRQIKKAVNHLFIERLF